MRRAFLLTALASLAAPTGAAAAAEAGSAGPSGAIPGVLYEKPWGPASIALLVGVLVLAAVAIGARTPRSAWLRNRLAPHVNLGTPAGEETSEATGKRSRLLDSLFTSTEKRFGHRSHWRKLERWVERSGLKIRTVEVVWVVVASGLGLAVVTSLLGASIVWIALTACVGAAVPSILLGIHVRRRTRAFDEQLPDLLLTIASSLKVGHSFTQGLQVVVEEGRAPAADEFRRVLNEAQLGQPMEVALTDMGDRVGSEDLRFVLESVAIQREIGGSLAELFETVAETVRERQQFRRKLKALTAMGRMSATVLVCLPFAVGLGIQALNRNYLDPLFSSSAGHIMLIGTLAGMAVGGLWLRKIVSFRS
jgi:tight adherence protein B